MPSVYGEVFDETVRRWAVVETEHDKIHPDRGQCGGVGGCSLMFVANTLEGEMVDALNQWRVSKASVASIVLGAIAGSRTKLS